ncbi:hypothetical protein BAUCODRAFT_148669 [Baudoinia panamericana UAMH 10762]|uniref:Uncharacterized protein n=1 Tax=Baudoinia panamericana (strain UAMH 10762) TaxID=717646 RepID=M2LN72_BAUPA|nr:uncharacterized protein BAUCODRAFT_148669 [Baudoinia panamericana UAMH 10762]EMC95797.1 hypothetical protein BAUCODRAFT_148669 [Baudoinia panamericana UAMH 10762]
MPIGEGNKTPWSESEMMIDQLGTVDWDGIDLPKDRTLTGAIKMIAKAKAKLAADVSGSVGGNGVSARGLGKRRGASKKAASEEGRRRRPKPPRVTKLGRSKLVWMSWRLIALTTTRGIQTVSKTWQSRESRGMMMASSPEQAMAADVVPTPISCHP